MVKNILIIEDHIIMADAYKNILLLLKQTNDAICTICLDCKSAFEMVTNQPIAKNFDLILLDYSIPAFAEEKLFNGVDIGIVIKAKMPDAKIIMITSISDSIKLFEIVKILRPDGLLSKGDVGTALLLEAIEKVLNDGIFYSKTIVKNGKEPLFTKGMLDTVDRKIIVLLAEGLQRGSIAKQLNLSEETIKKRKTKIKEMLKIEKGSDEDVLKACRALGML